MKLKKLVLQHFLIQPRPPNAKMDKYKCKYCTQQYVKHSTRMIQHLIICKGSPSYLKAQLKNMLKDGTHGTSKQDLKKRKLDLSASDSSSNEEDVEQNSICNETCKESSAKSIKNFFDKMSTTDQQKAKLLLAKAFYTGGIPHRFIENKYFLEFLSNLRPTFQPPSRNDLANEMLETIYAEIAEKVNEKVEKATSVAVQCDSYSNIKGEGLMNVVVTTPEPVFYSHIATNSDSQTGEYLAEKIINIVEKIGKGKVLAILTDNASYCKKAWKIVEENYKNDQIFAYGCIAHIINLICQDICKQYSTNIVMENAIIVVKEIKRSNILLVALKKIQKENSECRTISLKLPAKTRWGSSLDCLDSLDINSQNLKLLAISQHAQRLNALTKNLILDDEFWIKIKKLINLLRPVVVFLKEMEGDRSRISEVVNLFIDIKKHFESELIDNSLAILSLNESQNILNLLTKRSKMSLTAVHFAANILDPKFRGKKLNSDDFSTGTELIISLSAKYNIFRGKVMTELVEYCAESGFWEKTFVKQTVPIVPSIDWWKGVCSSTSISPIAIALLTLPPTTAATERSFSTYGWIHASKRNRLHIERASKITSICQNLRLFDPNCKLSKTTCDSNDDDDDNDDDEEEQEDEDEAVLEMNKNKSIVESSEINNIENVAPNDLQVLNSTNDVSYDTVALDAVGIISGFYQIRNGTLVLEQNN